MTDIKKTISVVMCTYNGENFIREQLDSILQQTVLADEIIIQDEFSTDSKYNITLIGENEGCFTEKYDYLVPRPLLQKAYAADKMNAPKVAELIEKL